MQNKMILEKDISHCKRRSLVTIFVKVVTLILFLAKILVFCLAILIWKIGMVRQNTIYVQECHSLTIETIVYFSFAVQSNLPKCLYQIQPWSPNLIKREKVNRKMLLQKFFSRWFTGEVFFCLLAFVFVFVFFLLSSVYYFFKNYLTAIREVKNYFWTIIGNLIQCKNVRSVFDRSG